MNPNPNTYSMIMKHPLGYPGLYYKFKAVIDSN